MFFFSVDFNNLCQVNILQTVSFKKSLNIGTFPKQIGFFPLFLVRAIGKVYLFLKRIDDLLYVCLA